MHCPNCMLECPDFNGTKCFPSSKSKENFNSIKRMKNSKNVKLVPLRVSGERVRIQCTFLDSWTVVYHRHNGQSPSRGEFLATQTCRSFFYFIFSRTRSKVCFVSVRLFSLFLSLLQSGLANLLSVTTLFLLFDNFSIGDLSHLHQYLKYWEKKRKNLFFLWVKRVCVLS